jgi:predicted ArsR family transcriptional regulator
MTMVDRLRLLAAVNMLGPPTTRGVARRLSVSTDEAKSALTDAERAHLVAKQLPENTPTNTAGKDRYRWRLSDKGRAQMYRLLHPH